MGDRTVNWSAVAIACGRIGLIVALALAVNFAAQRLIRAFRVRIAARMSEPEQVRRAETLGRAFRYLASVIVALIALVLVLSELGISVAPILGAAGVVGLAIGFGAQSLVKDYFTGFFMLLENQIIRGDVVQVADKAGLVEDVTLRYVQLRDYDGNVHFVPNGLITSVTNMSRGYAYAVVDVGVAYREDVDAALAVMRQCGDELRQDPDFADRILGPIEVVGVERWADSAVILRCRFRVGPLQQWDVRREYLRRLKRAFDQRGIEIPFPHLTLYAGVDRQGQAPAFRVTGAGGPR
ncbi:MAG: mechanosensitive ion channel family protein [Steroidobacteraceae bacterium]